MTVTEYDRLQTPGLLAGNPMPRSMCRYIPESPYLVEEWQ
jgi:hypothetical protein